MNTPLGDATTDDLAGALRTWMDDHRVPGAALAVTDASGRAVTLTDGLADAATREPVVREHRFQIGSLGKSLTAIAVLRAVERGKLDLDRPVVRFLPWIRTSLPHRVTIHQLLTHTSGLPMGADFSEDGRFDAWALRDVGPGGPPGHPWYSNVGYKVLGLILEAVTGRTYGEVIDEILSALDMSDSRATVSWLERDGEVAGHEPAPGAYPMRRAPRVRAPWVDLSTGDGSTSASAADMARYLAMLLRRGAGPAGRILSEVAFDRLTGRQVRVRPGLWWGYGFGSYRLDGLPVIGHGGDMLGFGSSMVVDIGSGLAVVVLANLRDAPCYRLAVRALRLARAERGIGQRPAIRATSGPNAQVAFAGRDGRSGERLQVDISGAGEGWLELDGRRTTVLSRGPDEFDLDDPILGRYPLRLERDRTGTVVAAVHGAHRFRPGSGRLDGPERSRLHRFVGRYCSHNPWRRTFDVLDRDGRLVAIEANGSEDQLVARGGGMFRVGPPRSPEWMRFDAFVEGHPLRASATGFPYYRSKGVTA